MLDPPAAMRVSYDGGVRNWFDPSLIQRLPVAMKPGDSLVSTISMPKGLVLKPQSWETVERGVDDSSPIRTAAVLTCVADPLPPDAFRPAFCDRQARIYLSRNLKQDASMDQPDWAREGKTGETFVNDMWAAHRAAPGMPPTDGWKQPHDDTYLKTAIEKAQRTAK
ncbi:MAG TPA: hypothetical protein PK640_16665 [Verrucomicrobiota bacterium]|nr:hypothetical protein [Verrucomicrobiota bacterium]